MNTEITPREFVKDEAYGLADELLVRKGFKISRTNSLNAIALACGFKNWNVLSACCDQGIEFDAVLVAEQHAESLATHLVERHALNITVLECKEILRQIAQEYAEVLAESARQEKEPQVTMPDYYSRQ